MIPSQFDALAQSLTGPFAFCGIAVQQADREPVFSISTKAGLKADPDTLFRVASISKIVTGYVVLAALRRMGLDPSLPLDVNGILGFPLRHPLAPETPITVAALASHTASLREVTAPADVPLATICQGDIFLPAPPNTTFSYSNLGYVLLAEIAERLTGDRFEDLAAACLANCATVGGFNWAGVTDVANTLPTFRRDGSDYIAQIDAPPLPFRRAVSVAGASPQGGLRTSLSGMLQVARSLKYADQTRLWTPDMGAFDTFGGVFESYGWGVQVFDSPAFYPRPLVGHFGNAYGFNGGVWYDPQRQIAMAYALNGIEMGDESDGFSHHELAIMRAIATFCDQNP